MGKFTVDPHKAALVIIDMQEFSCDLEDESARARLADVIGCINRLARACREAAIPVIWVRHNITSTGATHDGGFFPLFHSAERTRSVMDLGKGTELFSGMDVDAARDSVVFKNRYSAFLASPPALKRKLDELGRTQLIITGIAANVCVESTLRDAMQLDYEVFLVSDGTMGTDEASYQRTIKNTELFFGDVMSSAEVVDRICTH